MKINKAAFIASVVLLTSCVAEPVPGPDKQVASGLSGAVTGAGAGAITGFQLSAGAGPGAAVGAGVGAVAGGIQGFFQDQSEETLLELEARAHNEREKAWAHEVLNQQLKRRMALHPTREIYPADLFFYGDEAKLRPEAKVILMEVARLNKERLPWSTLVVAAYVKSEDTESTFAKYLAERRAIEIGDCLVKGGIEGRRIQTRAVLMPAPLLIDPKDKPDRYNQAIEFIPLER